jgi:hypothetical protein
MTRDDDFIGQLESYLDEFEGDTPMPDVTRDAIRAELPSIHQRPAWWPGWRLPEMNRSAVLAVGAAAVVIAALLGANVLRSGLNVGDSPATSPSLTEPAGALLEADRDTPLPPGTYFLTDGYPTQITFDPPDGYTACGDAFEEGVCSGTGAAIQFIIVDNVVADPCDRSQTLLDPPVGPTVDDLVVALTGLPEFEASSPVAITRDGYDGKQFELTAVVTPSCTLDSNGLRLWSTGRRVNGAGPGEVNIIQIFDVNGDRLMVAAAYQPTQPPGVRAALEESLDSIRLAP